MYPATPPGSDASFIAKGSIWQDIFSMLRWYRREREKQSTSKRRGTIWIRNDAGRDVQAGEILQLGTLSQVSDTSQVLTAQRSPVISADVPAWHDSMDRLIVCENPAANGTLFPYTPRTWASVSINNEADAGGSYVMPDANSPTIGRISKSGIWRVLGYDSVQGFAIVDLGQRQPLWRYELTEGSQAPGVTTAKLITLAGVEYAASINLSDPLSAGSDETTGYEGYCLHAGNEFIISEGPCA